MKRPCMLPITWIIHLFDMIPSRVEAEKNGIGERRRRKIE
jgi:hypothetical protein